MLYLCYLQRKEGEHLQSFKREGIPSTVNVGVTDVSENKQKRNDQFDQNYHPKYFT